MSFPTITTPQVVSHHHLTATAGPSTTIDPYASSSFAPYPTSDGTVHDGGSASQHVSRSQQNQPLQPPPSSTSLTAHSNVLDAALLESTAARETPASTQPFPNLFVEDLTAPHANRRRSLALPRIELPSSHPSGSVADPSTTPHPLHEVSTVASRSSSPYASPRLPLRTRQGGIGSMGEITLPPLSSAVPMRRGAVSGASSGPSLPFPPIRLPNEEDVPSRGPSPTLGKRPSFSLGHSNHVPPGPTIHLPPPTLSGDRRLGMPPSTSGPGLASSSSSSSYAPPAPGAGYGAQHPTSAPPESHHEFSRPVSTERMGEEGHGGYYYGNQGGHGMGSRASNGHNGWGTYGGGLKRSEPEPDEGPASGPMGAPYGYHQGPPRNEHQYGEDSYYSHQAHHGNGNGHGASAPPMGAGPYGPRVYGVAAPMPPNGPYGRFEPEAQGGPYGGMNGPPRHTGYAMSMASDDHLMSINGKRPRSAPRVLSSQPRIFACTQCPARFARNHDLKRHQRGHLSVRPYPCSWCGKSFSRKDALKRHVLVKGCGKDKKGGNNGDGGGRGGNVRPNGNGGGGSGDDGHTDHSRSDGAGDDDQHPDDDEPSDEEEDNPGERSESMGDEQSFLSDTTGHTSSQYNPYGQGQPQTGGPGHHQEGLYRWNKPHTMPTLAGQAAASLRTGEFLGAAGALAGFAASRRPSASIA